MPDHPPIVMRPWPRWLGLDEAAEYAGMGRDRLKSLALSGELTGFLDPDDRRGGRKSSGRWVFDRESLDAYRLGQAGLGAIKSAVVAGARRLGL